MAKPRGDPGSAADPPLHLVSRCPAGQQHHTVPALRASRSTCRSPAAKVAPGRFPLVVFGNGLTARGFFYTTLCEYLAGHGYVVVSFPSIGPGPGDDAPFDQRGIELQLGDMAFAASGERDKAESFRWVARYAERFLAAFLRGDAQALAFLESEHGTNGAPSWF